ncbi:MAG: tetratricopeptide repeat protein [Candidatus Cloacimonetes bacterium]|nr:tetratricopeptide repeat protein [Candidatus Cloacimonadota bacterium]
MFYGTTRMTRIIVIMAILLALCAVLSAKQKLSGEAKRFMRSGNMYWGQENWDKAAENYMKVLEIQPDYIDALKNMGDLYFYWGENKGQYASTEDGARVHAAPEIAVEHYLVAYDFLDRCLAALQVPDNYETGGKREKQLELQDDAEKKLKSCRVRLYNIAINQMNKANYELAESVALKVIELDPEYLGAITLMANICMKQEKNEQALEYFEQAALMSDDGALYRNVAALYYETEDYGKAVEWYQKAAEVEPEAVDNYYNMAVTYLQIPDNQGAFDAFVRVSDLEPGNTEALTWASNLASQLDKPDESILYLQKAIDAEPGNIEWLETICSKLFATERWEDLIESGEKWHAAAPEDPMPVMFLYQAANNLGRTADADRYNKLYNDLQ